MSGRWRRRSSSDLGEEGDVVAQDRAVGLQRRRAPRRSARRGRSRSGAACAAVRARRARAKVAASTCNSSRRAAKTASATCAGSAAVVSARAMACMRCAVSAATRRRRSFLRLRPGGPQLHVALAPQVGDPHRHRGGGQLGHHAERVVQLAVAVGRGADDEGEEGGQEPDERDPRGPGEGSGDEGGDGQEADQRDVPAVDGEDDRHGRDPERARRGWRRPRPGRRAALRGVA